MQDVRALITGGFGFVGSRLCERLVERNCEVAVLDDLSVGSPENLSPTVAEEVRQLVADVRDLAAVERHFAEFRPDVIFHLAAVHFIPTCESRPTLAVGVNVTGTQAVLEACSRVDSVRAVVAASSGAVYAPADAAHEEDSALGPTDIYGFTKEWTERLAGYFQRATGIPVGIARIFNVVGPGETNPHLLPAIIEQLLSGEELRLGNLATRRDYVFSGDVADGLAAMGATCLDGSGTITCNLGSESAVSGQELVELAARLAGREVAVTPDPARFRASDRPILLSDCRRARDLIGWSPETDLEDAVAAALSQPFAKGFAHV